MNQSINTDSKNSKESQQKYRLGTVSIKILGGLNRFYRRLTSPSASVMAQNIQLFGPRGGFLTHQPVFRVNCQVRLATEAGVLDYSTDPVKLNLLFPCLVLYFQRISFQIDYLEITTAVVVAPGGPESLPVHGYSFVIFTFAGPLR